MLRHAIASRFGDFTLFNVPSGALTLNGYKRGQQLEPTPVDTREGSIASAVLERSDVPLGSVSGNVKVVNAPGGALTSVVLVPQSVVDARLERGPIPLGLRAPGLPEAPSISGAFAFNPGYLGATTSCSLLSRTMPWCATRTSQSAAPRFRRSRWTRARAWRCRPRRRV